MAHHEIVIDLAFEGPPGRAQGGYACGVLASHLAGDAEITLRGPVPLGTALRPAPVDGGVALYHGAQLVAEGSSTSLAGHTPQPPSFAEALAATASFAGLRAHPYPRCVGCGTERA